VPLQIGLEKPQGVNPIRDKQNEHNEQCFENDIFDSAYH
jgi:hypothetical protein